MIQIESMPNVIRSERKIFGNATVRDNLNLLKSEIFFIVISYFFLNPHSNVTIVCRPTHRPNWCISLRNDVFTVKPWCMGLVFVISMIRQNQID